MNPLNKESLIYKPENWFEPLNLEKTFSPNPLRPIHVDLGAGDGGFIRARAKSHPDLHFLAVERLLGRARKISRDTLRDQLTNIRVMRIEASYAVEWLFPPQSISSITILFPDPWPKRRHHPNRLIQPDFLKSCARCLRPGGWLGIKTDNTDYFEHIQRCLQKASDFQIWKDIQASDLLPETTDFEAVFLQEKRPIHFTAVKKKV